MKPHPGAFKNIHCSSLYLSSIPFTFVWLNIMSHFIEKRWNAWFFRFALISCFSFWISVRINECTKYIYSKFILKFNLFGSIIHLCNIYVGSWDIYIYLFINNVIDTVIIPLADYYSFLKYFIEPPSQSLRFDKNEHFSHCTDGISFISLFLRILS